MNSKKVSVIVPVYNGENYVERCVCSLLKQNFGNFEIIIVNDGSTDCTESICKKLARYDSRVKLITTKNQGVSAARNLGIKMSEGDYLSFVDVDDYVDSSYLSILVKGIEDNDADISVCNYFFVVDDVAHPIHYSDNFIGLLNREQFLEGLISNCYRGFLWNKLFKKEVIKRDGEILKMKENITICEDLLFVVTASQNADKFFVRSQPLYYYVQNKNSAYNDSFKKKRLSEIIAYNEILQIIHDNSPRLMNKYKEAYLMMSLKIFELFNCTKGSNKDEETKMLISNTIEYYYVDVLKSTSINKKIYYMIYKKLPRLIHYMKVIYHFIKY